MPAPTAHRKAFQREYNKRYDSVETLKNAINYLGTF